MSLPDLIRKGESSRFLIVFAPSVRSPGYEQQMQLIRANEKELKSRGYAVITVLTSGVSTMEERTLTDSDVTSLREYCNIPDDQFSVLLMDATGKVLRQFSAPFKPEVLFKGDEIGDFLPDSVP